MAVITTALWFAAAFVFLWIAVSSGAPKSGTTSSRRSTKASSELRIARSSNTDLRRKLAGYIRPLWGEAKTTPVVHLAGNVR